MKKLDVAKLLVGVLGFVGLENGDWIGIADGTTMKSGNDKRHWIRFLNSLQKLEPVASFTKPYIEKRRSKELFVFVSDLYDADDEMLRFIKSLKSSRNEVIVFHLLGEKEASLDFSGAIRARDLETNQVVQLNAKTYAATYQKQLAEWKESWAHEFQMSGIDYQFASFNTPVATIINGFLNRRKQLL